MKPVDEVWHSFAFAVRAGLLDYIIETVMLLLSSGLQMN
jgi:hypothetical protein